MKKLLLALLFFRASFSYADLSSPDVYLYDYMGNPLSSTSNALNSFITNSTLACTQSGTWTDNQGTPAVTSNAWPIKVTDGTNVMGVAPASTAPTAAQSAAVVGLSPNGNQATAANQGTQITQLSSIFTAQSNGTQKAQVLDASGNVITVKPPSSVPLLTDTAIVTSERPDNAGTITMGTVSCATSSTTLLAAGNATMYLSIRNPTTASATVWIRFDGSAATASAPSIDLPPGAEWTGFAYGTSFLPSSQFNCISGGAAASTLGYNYK